MDTFYNAIILRYGEIALKKNNRQQFENCFVDNLNNVLRDLENFVINRSRGRMWIRHCDDSYITEEELELIHEQLPKAFGLHSYSPAVITESDIEKIKDVVADIGPAIFTKELEGRTKQLPFKVRARRGWKAFPLISRDIEIQIAEVIGTFEMRDDMKVDLMNAELTVGCEVREKMSFIYIERFAGPGGLPVNPKSPVLSLLSGGIDSPIACFMAMKRGCKLDFLTFHSAPYTTQESVDKVIEVSETINEYQKPGKLYVANLAPFQRAVRDKCEEKFRTILYRRAMMRIAEKVALENGQKALLTGEAIGQVASQTLDNMTTIDRAVKMLILRPLLGMDKEDIITLARKYDTMDISSVQCADSCTVFAPKSAATSSKEYRLRDQEEKIENYDELLDQVIAEIEVIEG